MKRKWLFMLIFILTIVVLTACSNENNNEENAATNNDSNNTKKDENQNEGELDFEKDTNQDTDLPDADLDDVPDVVAEVNGDEIVKDDFANVYEQQFQKQVMQAQMSGQDIDDIDEEALKKEAAELMADQTLLIQEAKNTISDVSDDAIDEVIEELIEQNDMDSKDDLIEAFEEQGVDEKTFMSEVETQVKLNQLLEDITTDIEVTEDETKEAYETMISEQEEAGSDEEPPEFNDIKSDLEEQLLDQKKAEETEAYVETLREDADITIHL